MSEESQTTGVTISLEQMLKSAREEGYKQGKKEGQQRGEDIASTAIEKLEREKKDLEARLRRQYLESQAATVEISRHISGYRVRTAYRNEYGHLTIEFENTQCINITGDNMKVGYGEYSWDFDSKLA